LIPNKGTAAERNRRRFPFFYKNKKRDGASFLREAGTVSLSI